MVATRIARRKKDAKMIRVAFSLYQPTVVFPKRLHGSFLRPFSCARYELLPLAAILSAMPMVLHTTQQVHRASLRATARTER
jgi:hypothetical protein